MQVNLEMQSHLSSLQVQITKYQDVQAELTKSKLLINNMQDAFNHLRNQLDHSADQLIQANQLVAQSNQTVYYLTERVREMEDEIIIMA